MFKVQKIWLAAALLVVAAGANADGHPTITIPEETFSVQGELMNLELSDGGGVITVAAIAGKYGRVFLTYNMSTNPNSKTQGQKLKVFSKTQGIGGFYFLPCIIPEKTPKKVWLT